MVVLNYLNEIWQDIPNFEGLYQSSTYGRIRSMERVDARGFHRKSIILKPSYCKGYPKVLLFKNGVKKSYYAHRLVAETFIPNPNNLPYVNHKDCNPSNCCVDNLEWCTAKYNVSYAEANNKRINNRIGKTAPKPVYQYDLEGNLICTWSSASEAARKLGYKQNMISRCCTKTIKTAYGYIWNF